MKILYISIPKYIPSGVVSVTQYLVEGVKNYGFDVRLVSCWPGTGYYDYKNYCYDSTKETAPLTASQIAEVAREFRPDIIHVHTMGVAESWHGGINLIKETAGNPVLVYTLHTPKQAKYDLPTIEMCNISDVVITLSESHKLRLGNLYPDIREKIVAIHNFPEPTFFELSKSKEVDEYARQFVDHYTPKNEKIILYIGRVEELKGLKFLFLAFKNILLKYPSTKLLLVGSFGGAEERKFIQDCGISDKVIDTNIVFINWVRNDILIAAYYRMLFLDGKVNGVVVTPIAYRALMVFMNAIAMKSPAVTFGEIDDSRLATASSLLAHPRNIFNCIDDIFSAKPSEIKRRIDNSYELVKNTYSLENYIEKHVELYERLLKSKKPRGDKNESGDESNLDKIFNELLDEGGELDRVFEQFLNEDDGSLDSEFESILNQ